MARALVLLAVLAVACSGEPNLTVEELVINADVPRPVISATVILPPPACAPEAIVDAGADQ